MAGSAVTAYRHGLLLLAAAVLCGVAVREAQAQVKPKTLAPVTVFSKFKPTNLEYLKSLKAMPVKTAFANYLTATKQPYLPNDKVKMANFAATLQKLVDDNAGSKLKHSFGINAFTQMNFTERARFLSLRGKSRTRAQGIADNAEFLRQTSGTSLADMEAAAERMYALAAEKTAAMRTSAAQTDDEISWFDSFGAIRKQGTITSSVCNAGWAFAAAAAAEGASFANTNYVVSLAAKQLIDCDPGNSDGCNGGLLEPAFKYIVTNGLTSEDELPYEPKKKTCPTRLSKKSQLASFTPLPPNNEAAMLEALRKGPIAVAMTVDAGFQQYNSNIYYSDACTGSEKPLNHAAVIIGAGRDVVDGTPYWLLRLSWGEEWGAAGTMRLLRNIPGTTGTCNIAMQPYQVVSADVPDGVPPIAPGEDTGCSDTTESVTSTTSLADIAKQYKTTVAQIQLDNDLADDPTTPLAVGRELSITCPTGIWSEVYGIWKNKNAANAMVAAPTVCICDPGQYVSRVEIMPSLFYEANKWTGSTYVGRVTITCTGGETDDKQCTIDAQPDVSDSRSGLEPGAIAQSNGFTSVPFTSNFAIDSLFGVGASTGGEAEYKCPQDMVLTGVAGGAEPVNYLTDKESYISGLQFRCSNARGLPSDSAAVQKMRSQIKASFPRVAMGRSCRTVNLSKYATKDLNWQGVASRSGVLVNELMRANPDIKLPITSSTPVFLPPCNYGKAPPKRPPVRARAVTMDIDS